MKYNRYFGNSSTYLLGASIFPWTTSVGFLWQRWALTQLQQDWIASFSLQPSAGDGVLGWLGTAAPMTAPSSLCHPGLVTAVLFIYLENCSRAGSGNSHHTPAAGFTHSYLQIITQLNRGLRFILGAALLPRIWQSSSNSGMLRIRRRNATPSTCPSTSSPQVKKGWASDYAISSLPPDPTEKWGFWQQLQPSRDHGD